MDKAERYTGGAEMSAFAARETAPDGVEIVTCHAGDVTGSVDAYVVHNCTSYDRSIIPLLKKKPVIKRVYDVWPHGDPDLRLWLLANSAAVLLSGPLQQEAMAWQVTAPVTFVPSGVDVKRFRNAAPKKRKGVVMVARLWPGKGIDRVRQWAQENEVVVDVYGFGPEEKQVHGALNYRGPVEYAELPQLLAGYETFVFLPSQVEPFSRTTAEAWAAGCKLVVNGNVGALWWIENQPEALENAAQGFWEAVEEVLH